MTGSSTGEYRKALDWLFRQTRAGAARSPERAARLLRRLGLAAPPITVSVVGTNGKGSVSSMIAAGLSAAGYVTGRFISPHVESFRERVAVDGRLIAEERVVEFVRRARESSADPGADPAFFEWTLALALDEFARQGAAAAVLEAGVGGGSDATRAVEDVSLVVLTNVDLDHLEVLGPTLKHVASDKVGAMRPGRPFVSGALQPSVRRIVAREAERLRAPLHQLEPAATRSGELFAIPAAIGQAFDNSPTRSENARLAAAALRVLGVGEAAVLRGLRAPPLPARGERFRLTDQPRTEVLLDGAHDPAAARRLLEQIGARPYSLLFGALARKQGQAVLDVLAARAAGVVLTEAQEGDGPGPGAADSWPFVADAAAALDLALEAARRRSREGPAELLVVAGSLYLAGRVRPLLRERGERLPAPWEEG